jgi:hypothetical protein
MGECVYCAAYEEAIDLLCNELQKERRKRRDLFRTIRLLKKNVIQNLEVEHALACDELIEYKDTRPDC